MHFHDIVDDDDLSLLATLHEMNAHGCAIELVTFGALAQCCYRWKLARDLLISMTDQGMRPGLVVYDSLAANAMHRMDTFYLAKVLQGMERNREELSILSGNLLWIDLTTPWKMVAVILTFPCKKIAIFLPWNKVAL